MTDFVSPQHLARRTSAAVDAAVGAGRDLGLTITDAAVLHDLFSVVVHLAPAPVVARVPVVVPYQADPDSQTRRMQAELDVTQWLADRGVPVIPPSPLVPREPVWRQGYAMTFWQFVEEDHCIEPDYVANSESTADLHAAMRTYPGDEQDKPERGNGARMGAWITSARSATTHTPVPEAVRVEPLPRALPPP